MNYFKWIVVGIVSLIFLIGDIHVGEAKGKSRKFAADPASANGPTPALSQEEVGKKIVKSLLHEMFAEEEKKYPALKAHLDDESKKTFQEAYMQFRSGPPSVTIMRIKGSKDFYIYKTGIAEIISAPRITSIVPADKIEANNMLTIFGENLQNAREVTFSGVKGSISSSSSGKIRVIVPNVEGQKRIYAVTPTGTAQWDYCNIFKGKPPPAWTPPPVAKPTPPSPPPPPKVDPITKNALGNPEYCFGAVGKGCGGFGDLKDDETKATRPGYLAAGCSEEVGGKRRCWVVPGSIKHDNCCVGHPHGKHCGGPMSDGSNAGEWNHDGSCDKEWDDSVWDVKNGRGWEFDFVVKEPGNLTPAESPGGRYSGLERVGTVGLCAPDDASISARHNVAFCCSGNVKKYWALGVEDWYICQPKSNRGVQQIGGKQEGTPTQLNMSKSPSKPGEPKQQPVAVAQKAPIPVITSVAKTEVEPEEIVTIYGKNFIAQDANGSKSINLKQLFFVQNGKEKPMIANAGKNRGDEESIFFMAPKETGSYSIKIISKSGEIVTWDNPPIAVISLAPVITHAPASAEPEANVSIRGKNFTRVGEKMEMSNVQAVFWVKDKTETKAQGISTIASAAEDKINLKAPKEPGNYSLKVVTGKGTAVWSKPLVSVAKKSGPPIQPQPALLPPPPPPSQVAKEKPEEPVAVKQEPQEEAPPKCEQGTWSPTFKRCIEDQVKEEAPPPDCGAGAHWSPTLKSCQSD